MSKVELHSKDGGKYELLVDGVDMSLAVKRIEIAVHAGYPAEVTLTLTNPRIVTSVEAEVTTEQDEIVEKRLGEL